jgi:CobQ/CobB/MinD/ParA nucleotide binding domain
MGIIILAKQGGVGKSTLALHLHEAFRHDRTSVAMRDWDTPGTSTQALRRIDGQPAVFAGTSAMLLEDTAPTLEHVATALRSNTQTARRDLACTSGQLGGRRGPTLCPSDTPGVARLICTNVRRRTILAQPRTEVLQCTVNVLS